MADTEDDRERFLARFNDNCIGIRGFLEGWWFGFSFRYEGREYSFSTSPGRLYSGEKNLFTLYRIKGSLENEETDGQAAEPVCDMTKSSSDGSVISSFRNFLQRLLRGSPDWSSDSASDCRDRTSISQDGKTFILLAKANGPDHNLSLKDRLEKKPSFKGKEGEEAIAAFRQWCQSRIQLPPNGDRGRVQVKFVVGRNGKVQEVQIEKGATPALNEEAMRVVRSSPKWKPSRISGDAIRTICRVTLLFE